MNKRRLEFVNRGFTGKTFRWDVENDGFDLGVVSWYAPWRRYCFYPSAQTVFDASCLREITEFIDGEMEKRKAA